MKIAVYFYSEPNCKGNCSLYFLKGIYGKNVCLGGVDTAKVYLPTQTKKLNQHIDIIKRHYPSNVKIEIYG